MWRDSISEEVRVVVLAACRTIPVTKKAAAKLLGWSVTQLQIAIAAGDVETYGTCGGDRVLLSEIPTTRVSVGNRR